jgi:hypothetical protein
MDGRIEKIFLDVQKEVVKTRNQEKILDFIASELENKGIPDYAIVYDLKDEHYKPPLKIQVYVDLKNDNYYNHILEFETIDFHVSFEFKKNFYNWWIR